MIRLLVATRAQEVDDAMDAEAAIRAIRLSKKSKATSIATLRGENKIGSTADSCATPAVAEVTRPITVVAAIAVNAMPTGTQVLGNQSGEPSHIPSQSAMSFKQPSRVSGSLEPVRKMSSWLLGAATFGVTECHLHRLQQLVECAYLSR